MTVQSRAMVVPGRFDQQVVVVTGGASGIGLAVARRLRAEGAHVVVWDRDARNLAALESEPLFKAGVDTAVVDVADDAVVGAEMARVVAAHTRVDAVVHCAGIVGPNNRPVAEVRVEEFAQVCQVNLIGSFVVTHHALRAMLPRRYGRVLLFASIAGKEGNAGMCAYSASKAGVIGLAKSAGKEVAESGITVNAIAPGVIQTPLVDAMAPAQVTYMTDRIPMRRTGTLDEIAALTCFIVSREASFTTGFTFDLSGGRATY